MTEDSVAVVGGRVVPVAGDPIDGGMVLAEAGRITAVGTDLAIPPGSRVIDAAGRWVLPGFIEAHGHVGVHEEGEGWAGSDTNELTDPVTAQVRALDAVNPADLGFRDAISGGVLAVNINPGSGNPIGGQTVAVKCWGRTVRRDGAAPAVRDEVGPRREPQAGLRRAAQDAEHPARHGRGDPQCAGGRGQLSQPAGD